MSLHDGDLVFQLFFFDLVLCVCVIFEITLAY